MRQDAGRRVAHAKLHRTSRVSAWNGLAVSGDADDLDDAAAGGGGACRRAYRVWRGRQQRCSIMRMMRAPPAANQGADMFTQ